MNAIEIINEICSKEGIEFVKIQRKRLQSPMEAIAQIAFDTMMDGDRENYVATYFPETKTMHIKTQHGATM